MRATTILLSLTLALALSGCSGDPAAPGGNSGGGGNGTGTTPAGRIQISVDPEASADGRLRLGRLRGGCDESTSLSASITRGSKSQGPATAGPMAFINSAR